MAKALNPKNGFIVHGWMVSELKLRGPELLTYAIVHQFSQSKAGIYKGGVPYVMAWIGCNDDSARKYLHSLEARGLIKAIEGRNNGVPYRYYEVADNQIPENLGGIPENIGVDTRNFREGIPEILGVDNKKDNKGDNNTPPTPSEVAAYCREKGFADPEGFAAYYVSWQTETGWKLKNGKPIENWKLNVLTWGRNHKDEHFSKPKTSMRQMTDAEYLESLKR